MSRELRFVVDAMLGDVARWLRILGYDTIYSRKFRDEDLLDLAIKDGRVLLTRDRALHKRAVSRRARSVLLTGLSIEEKLYEVAKALNLELFIDEQNTRCPLCNTKLRRVGREEVCSRVPWDVCAKHKEFWLCAGCGKVYWRGGHWRGIARVLEAVNRRIRATGKAGCSLQASPP